MLLLYISENIALWEGVLVLIEVKYSFRTSTPSQSEIFSLNTVIVDLTQYFTLEEHKYFFLSVNCSAGLIFLIVKFLW